MFGHLRLVLSLIILVALTAAIFENYQWAKEHSVEIKNVSPLIGEQVNQKEPPLVQCEVESSFKHLDSYIYEAKGKCDEREDVLIWFFSTVEQPVAPEIGEIVEAQQVVFSGSEFNIKADVYIIVPPDVRIIYQR